MSDNWKVLTRKDIPHFDDAATSAVLWAMAHGGVGRISSNGHALLRSPGGETMSVTRNSFKSKQIVAQKLARLFPPKAEEPSSPPALKEPEPAPLPPTMNPTLTCTVKGCEAVFVTEGARYSHIHDKHHVCKFPGCQFASDRAQGTAAHYRIVHEGIAPRTVGAQRKREREQVAIQQLEVPQIKPKFKPPAKKVRVAAAQEKLPEPEDLLSLKDVMVGIAESLQKIEARLEDRIAKLEYENRELRGRLRLIQKLV